MRLAFSAFATVLAASAVAAGELRADAALRGECQSEAMDACVAGVAPPDRVATCEEREATYACVAEYGCLDEQWEEQCREEMAQCDEGGAARCPSIDPGSGSGSEGS